MVTRRVAADRKKKKTKSMTKSYEFLDKVIYLHTKYIYVSLITLQSKRFCF